MTNRIFTMNSRSIAAALLALGAIGSAHASISGLTEISMAQVYQVDFSNFYVYDTGTGPAINFTSPYSVNTPGGDYIDSAGSFSGGVGINTSSHVQATGSFFGYVNAFGTGDFPQSVVAVYDELLFDTDSTAQVKLIASSTTLGSSGTGQNDTVLYLDGIFYSTVGGDGNFSVTVGAGSHVAYYEAVCQAHSGVNAPQGGGATMSQNYLLNVTTPEPTSIVALGIGALSLLRRRRRA